MLCTVYLIHFSAPLGLIERPRRVQHYIGQTTRPVAERLSEHRSGGRRASRVCRQAVREGVDILLARTWPDVPRTEERRLKKRSMRKLCPVCSGQ